MSIHPRMNVADNRAAPPPARARALHADRQSGSGGAFLAAVLLAALMVLGQALSAAAREVPYSYADLVEKLSPAVVNITTSTSVATVSGPRPQVPEGSPLEDFFRDFLDRNNRGPQGERNRPRRSSALGSGFIISEDGYIVTNNHVIDKADEVKVELFSGKELVARVIGVDPNTDIALLKVESDTPLPFVRFGDSDKARVGDRVLAIGNPLGQGFSVSAGIVSARNRALRGTYDDYIQTDAAINRGNSGGPLFNMEGEVIGVNTAILSPTGGSIGIGFSMASNVVAGVVQQLRTYGETRRGWLGVRIQDVTPDVADAIGLEKVAGALVTDVPEGPSRDAGMLAGDVILRFNGRDVADTRGLVRMVGNADVGAVVPVTVFRDGAMRDLSVTLGRREEAEGSAAPGTPEAAPDRPQELLGMRLSPVTPELREQLALTDDATGLVVLDVDETTEAFDKGLRAGDVIVEVGQQRVATVRDLEGRIRDARDAGRNSILLLVRRQGEPRFVALTLGGR